MQKQWRSSSNERSKRTSEPLPANITPYAKRPDKWCHQKSFIAQRIEPIECENQKVYLNRLLKFNVRKQKTLQEAEDFRTKMFTELENIGKFGSSRYKFKFIRSENV